MFQHPKFSSSIRAHGPITGLLEKQAQPRGKHKSKGSSAVVLETAERHTDFSRGVWNALFRSPLKLDHDCSYTWRQETENWQEKENQQLRQTRSRHTGHFQRYHPKMGSTTQQLHISGLRETVSADEDPERKVRPLQKGRRVPNSHHRICLRVLLTSLARFSG